MIDPSFDTQRGWVEVNFAPFFCVLIPRLTLDRAGPLDAINGRHYRSDRIYCDWVRGVLGLRVIYAAGSKLYHLLQQSTDYVRDTDKAGFEEMFVRNEWGAKPPGGTGLLFVDE